MNLKADATVSASTAMSRSAWFAKEVAAGDLKLNIRKDDGSVDETWEKFSEYDPYKIYPTGDYTVSAWYGSIEDEGFDSPYYFGQSKVRVTKGDTPVSLTARLANTMIQTRYTDAFTSYFTDWSVTFRSAEGTPIVFEKDETRTAYLRPGNISIEIKLTKPNGNEITVTPAEISDALPRFIYFVTFNVNEGNVGNTSISITFDEETVKEPVEIILNENILNANIPFVHPEGFINNENLTISAGEVRTEPLRFVCQALNGFASITLVSSSEWLQSFGIPEELDLLSATVEQKNKLLDAGLVEKGVWGNMSNMCIVDLEGFIEKIGRFNGGGDHSFAIKIKDAYSNESETVGFSVHVNEQEIQ